MSEMKPGDVIFIHGMEMRGMLIREVKEPAIVVGVRACVSFTAKLVKPRADGAEFVSIPSGEKGRMWS